MRRPILPARGRTHRARRSPAARLPRRRCSVGEVVSRGVAGGLAVSSRNGFAVSAWSISCANSSADICSRRSACWTCGVRVRCCLRRRAIAGPMGISFQTPCLQGLCQRASAGRSSKNAVNVSGSVAITARGRVRARALLKASRDMADRLDRYREMRDFAITPEPRGKKNASKKKQLHYYIQRHAATRLHYDFRLELEGVLKSWAVPKGPSLNPADKRLAVQTEDHPLEYGEFEGVIPEKQYGAGEVLLWDRGVWTPEDRDPARCAAQRAAAFSPRRRKAARQLGPHAHARRRGQAAVAAHQAQRRRGGSRRRHHARAPRKRQAHSEAGAAGASVPSCRNTSRRCSRRW